MPNPHFRVEVIARSEGQSVVAAAAYRSGEILYDERAGKTFDYSRKEDVLYAEIMTPDDAPSWAGNRAMLWNKVEFSEKRKDAQLARNIIAALPRELDQMQNVELVRDFVKDNFTAKGMIADLAIHESDAGDGLKNPHAHILVTLRPIHGETFGKKNREWNSKNTLNGWRRSWEEHTNKYLELAGSPERVSLQSYKDLGINKHAQIHLGEDAGNLEKRGVKSKRGDINRRIQHENALIEMLSPPENEPDSSETDAREADFDETSRILDADPAVRLEVMALELKDDMETQSNFPASEQEAMLGAFRSGDDDPQKLAESSLAASRAIHEAALHGELQSAPYQPADVEEQQSLKDARVNHRQVLGEYLASPEYETTRQQAVQNVTLQEYARRTTEKIKALGEKVRRQFSNLIRETSRLKERDRDDRDR